MKEHSCRLANTTAEYKAPFVVEACTSHAMHSGTVEFKLRNFRDSFSFHCVKSA